MTHTEVGNELSIPISALNNIMVGKRNILQQCITIQPAEKVKYF
jgi:hypothetical protein